MQNYIKTTLMMEFRHAVNPIFSRNGLGGKGATPLRAKAT
jgi:hypothetical protein